MGHYSDACPEPRKKKPKRDYGSVLLTVDTVPDMDRANLDSLLTMPALGQSSFATHTHPLKHLKHTTIAKVHVPRAEHDLPAGGCEAFTSGRSEHERRVRTSL